MRAHWSRHGFRDRNFRPVPNRETPVQLRRVAICEADGFYGRATRCRDAPLASIHDAPPLRPAAGGVITKRALEEASWDRQFLTSIWRPRPPRGSDTSTMPCREFAGSDTVAGSGTS